MGSTVKEYLWVPRLTSEDAVPLLLLLSLLLLVLVPEPSSLLSPRPKPKPRPRPRITIVAAVAHIIYKKFHKGSDTLL